MNIDHARLSSLFLKALGLAQHRRDRFLQRIGRHDAALAEEIRTLLRHHDAPHPILGAASDADGGAFHDPDKIGSYEIESVLGEGGMGRVYLAKQEHPLRRQVAIKLHSSSPVGADFAHRLEIERQALAAMNHPNVAGLYDAGSTADGSPWFAMEYVNGPPLLEYCDAERLGIRRRLELFLEVCAGIQHAHRNAILHRDVKPANVLVSLGDGRPVPKVIDFGIAKLLHSEAGVDARATRQGQLVGTPASMSPEQAQLGWRTVDTRTDVYGLGALLYELLTGRPPVDLTSGDPDLDEIRRRISEDIPVRPSRALAADIASGAEVASRRGTTGRALVRQVAGDLDAISNRALEKEPGDRYDSVSDLAADLQRHLAGEPILAAPPGPLSRALKLVRRHRLAASLAAALLIVLMSFSSLMAVQAGRLARERERALEGQKAAVKGAELLIDLFDVAPNLQLRSGAVDPGSMLDHAVTTLDSRSGVDPLLHAKMLKVLAELSSRMGRKDWRDLRSRARESLTRLLGPDDPLTLEVSLDVRPLRWDESSIRESEAALLRLLAAQRAKYGAATEASVHTMRELVLLYREHGTHEEARGALGQLVEYLRVLRPPDDPDILIARSVLASTLLKLDKWEEGGEILVEIEPKLREQLGVRNFEALAALYNLSWVYYHDGDASRARALLRESIELGFGAEVRVPPTPYEPGSDPDLEELAERQSMNRKGSWARAEVIGRQLQWEGRWEEAAWLSREVFEAKNRVLGPDHEATLDARAASLSAALDAGRHAAVEVEIERLRDVVEVRDDLAALLPLVLWQLAQCRLARGEQAAALELSRQAKALYGAQLGEADVNCAHMDASIRSLTGDGNGALGILEAAYPAGGLVEPTFERDLAFRPLRSLPRYRAFLEARRPSSAIRAAVAG